MSIEIFDNSLIKLLVRQGTDNERKNVILNPGEPGYTTDTRRLFIGDGATRGGVVAGNVFKGSGASITLFAPAEVGDLAYSTSDKLLYRLKENDGSRISDWEEIANNSTTVSNVSGAYVSKSGDTITLNASRAGLLIKQLGAGNALEVEDPNSTATRFVITNQGLVGIGTNTLSAALDVVALSSNLARFVGGGNQSRGISVQNNFAALTAEASVFFTVNNESGNAVSNIQTIVRTDGASEMVFQTQGSGTRTDRRTERLRINNDGNVVASGIVRATTLQGNLSGQIITLVGDVSGSGRFSNSNNLNITTSLSGSPSVAKAWVTFNSWDFTPPTILDSYNISSISDIHNSGTGYYRVNFTKPMPSVNYVWAASAEDTYITGGTGDIMVGGIPANNDGGGTWTGRTVDGFDIGVFDAGVNPRRSKFVSIVIF